MNDERIVLVSQGLHLIDEGEPLIRKQDLAYIEPLHSEDVEPLEGQHMIDRFFSVGRFKGHADHIHELAGRKVKFTLTHKPVPEYVMKGGNRHTIQGLVGPVAYCVALQFYRLGISHVGSLIFSLLNMIQDVERTCQIIEYPHLMWT